MAQPRVVVSIAPLHSLVAGVMDGVGEPHLLIQGGASPHAYAMKPSDAKALERADLIVWVGKEMERFLAKPVSALGGGARSLELMDAPGVQLLYPGGSGAENAVAEADHDDEGDHGHDHDHDHDPTRADPHIWLAPDNARAIVAAVAAALESVDPENAKSYRTNAEKVAARLAALTDEIKNMLVAVADGRFVVFHDAYRYFENAFGLRHADAIAVNPGRMPGARHLSELRREIVDSGAVCVYREPQFTPKLAQAIVTGTKARLGILDPLGVNLKPGPDLYFGLMRGNASALAECLATKSPG